MDTEKRIAVYTRGHERLLTHRQRRRMIKKAGRDPRAVVIRDAGMGYAPGMQGYRELAGIYPRPVSGIPAV